MVDMLIEYIINNPIIVIALIIGMIVLVKVLRGLMRIAFMLLTVFSIAKWILFLV